MSRRTGASEVKCWAGVKTDQEEMGTWPRWSSGKESACNARDTGDLGSIPGLGRSPGVGNGNPLQYSCLENSMDRGAWRATVHGVTESQTRLSTYVLCLCHTGLKESRISMVAEQKKVVFSKHEVLWMLRSELENRLLVAWRHKQIKGISFQQQEPFRGNQSDRGVSLKIKARRSISEGAGWEEDKERWWSLGKGKKRSCPPEAPSDARSGHGVILEWWAQWLRACKKVWCCWIETRNSGEWQGGPGCHWTLL